MLRSRGGKRRPESTPGASNDGRASSSFIGADASSFDDGDRKKVMMQRGARSSSALGESSFTRKHCVVNLAILSMAASIGVGAGLWTLSLMGVLPPHGASLADATNSNAIASMISSSLYQLWRTPTQHITSTSTISRHPQFVYDTPEYKQECSWTYRNGNSRKPSCHFLVRPNPKSREGIAQWVSSVAHGYIYSVQTGCSLAIDYGPTVELEKVWSPPAALPKDQSWVNPPEMICTEEKNCWEVGMMGAAWIEKFLVNAKAIEPTQSIAEVPDYRAAYSRSDNATEAAEKLQVALPGFQYKTGFACAFGHLFDLPQSAADYMPSLFTNILPAVRDTTALIIAVYIRTGRTDDKALEEREGKASGHYNHTHVDSDLLRCAAEQEKQLLLDDVYGKYKSAVWLVITDSADTASSVVEQYHGKMESVRNRRKVPRRVISTQSQGIQTRPARNPSTGDFADAALDWWLIGEADIVVTHGVMSFGTTAALRTALPLYTAIKGECKRRELDMDGSAIVPGFLQVNVPRGGGPLNILEELKKQGFKVNGNEIKMVKRIDQ